MTEGYLAKKDELGADSFNAVKVQKEALTKFIGIGHHPFDVFKTLIHPIIYDAINFWRETQLK